MAQTARYSIRLSKRTRAGGFPSPFSCSMSRFGSSKGRVTIRTSTPCWVFCNLPRPRTYRLALVARSDVLVGAKEILWVVLLLQLSQPCVVHAIGGAHRGRSFLSQV